MIETVLAAAAVAMVAIAANLRRRAQPPAELEPNLLMTKRPLEFWTGPRTLFHFHDYWSDLPLNLREHGYEVHSISLSWRNRRARRQEAEKRLLSNDCHLVIDEITFHEMNDLLQRHPPTSLTVLPTPKPQATLDLFCFRLHTWTLFVFGFKSIRSAPADPRAMRHLLRDLAESDWTEGEFAP